MKIPLIYMRVIKREKLYKIYIKKYAILNGGLYGNKIIMNYTRGGRMDYIPNEVRYS